MQAVVRRCWLGLPFHLNRLEVRSIPIGVRRGVVCRAGEVRESGGPSAPPDGSLSFSQGPTALCRAVDRADDIMGDVATLGTNPVS